MSTDIKVATADEMEDCLAVIALAFGTDGAARWLYPQVAQYWRDFPVFARAFGGPAFARESAFYLGEFHSVALWLPPGVAPDEELLVSHIQSTVPQERQEPMFAVIEQMASYHPDEPHWHLPFVGTDPVHQNKGFGTRLLQHALARFDERREVAYLEASSQRSVCLYERLGFKILGTIQVGDSPVITPMVRRPA